MTNPSKPAEISPDDARAIAKEAYIYGFPMASNYHTMYKQAIDTTDRDYQGAFNTVNSSKSVSTPDDKFVVTPNSDTPYSYLWMDLRAEPIVITMPKIEPNRYYTGQMVDLYTYNFAYLGTRSHGNDGGRFMVAGPGWNGETPKGVKAVIRSETEFAYVLFSHPALQYGRPTQSQRDPIAVSRGASKLVSSSAGGSSGTRGSVAEVYRRDDGDRGDLSRGQLSLPVLPAQSV